MLIKKNEIFKINMNLWEVGYQSGLPNLQLKDTLVVAAGGRVP